MSFLLSTFIIIFGYKLSYLEFIGVLFNLSCVYLVAQYSIWNWVAGIIGAILFGVLFYQIQLYSDMFLQIFFFLTNCYGLYTWLVNQDRNKQKLTIRFNSQQLNFLIFLLSIVCPLSLGYLVSNLNYYLPTLFPKPAAYPYLDTTIAVLSILATFLMIYKRIESWVLWIMVDVIAIEVYYNKHIFFITLLYGIFLVLSIGGLINWIRLKTRGL